MESGPNARQPVSAAAILRINEGQVELLSARRTEPAHLAGGWEFPGGKWDPGEDGLSALHRELFEELGVLGLNVLIQVKGPLPDGAWPMGEDYALHVYACTLPAGQEPYLREQHDALEWVPITDPLRVDWLAVDVPAVLAVAAWLSGEGS